MKARALIALLQISCVVFMHTRGYSQGPVNISNPVLPGVADAGVIRYNGEYYIGGVFTNGSFYRSRDLVKWEGPFHVFSMDNGWTTGPSAADSQIHANDISYINGVFHLYWSVNHWGSDQHVVHIGHATAANVLGPYKEPVKETWLDNRIDPKLFIDDDGSLYLYMVKFTDGNAIWARPMKDPQTFSGPPVSLFPSLPNTWETVDNRVAEGPWVMKYRNRYFMMYNTNHTSTRWGNYMLGVAEADSPLGFNHGTKYSSPVVQSNQIELDDRFVDLLKYAEISRDTFLYSTNAPARNWNTLDFDASRWQKGKAGFGSTPVKNSTTRKVKTLWQTPEIWVRKSFTAENDTHNLMLRIHHDGATKVFLNGQPVYEGPGRNYTTWNFDQRARALVKKGENVLAIHSEGGKNSGFLDVALFDMRDHQGDDILYSPGQPNILRGPNGFEWWLIYMANKNSEKRGQFINRMHFFNKKMFADAVTGGNTSGYHPAPAQPTFGNLFNTDGANKLNTQWNLTKGSWQIKDGELVQSSHEAAHAIVKSTPAAHYLFEVGVKFSSSTTKAGVYAWWHDRDNSMKIEFDPKQKRWSYVQRVSGKSETSSFPLPDDFNYQAYHSIRIFKNGERFSVEIDERPAPGDPVMLAPGCSGKGVPGLWTDGGGAAFDGVVYTIGWDEFDDTITGWSSSLQGAAQQGSWSVSGQGIVQSEVSGESQTFKGDMLDEYEISIQLTNETDGGTVGIFPVYIDDDNFLKAVVEYESKSLIISGERNGRPVGTSRVPLEVNTSYHADMRFTDFIEKHFTFDYPGYINAISLRKRPFNDPDTVIENIHERFNISFQQQGRWYPLAEWKEASSSHPGFEKIEFTPVKAEALRFVNKDPEDHRFYVNKIRVNELLRQSYNLRVVKRKDEIIFFVDGVDVLRMDHMFPASQVGLVTENTKAEFNGITVFSL
ncbi:MAG: family 43 glycosylhydrolase [Bacteroidota bacterium]|nr:family 43 glycosylhydrolase [Bacteroidota bacterium]